MIIFSLIPACLAPVKSMAQEYLSQLVKVAQETE